MAHNAELTKGYFYEVLPPAQKAMLDVLVRQHWMGKFYLVGETALALHIGHRRSVDFNFSPREAFINLNIISHLRTVGQFELFEQARNTIHGSLDDVKISFLRYNYPFAKPLHPLYDIKIADAFDIALMKLSAISGRGAKKDFIDFYFLLQRFSLSELFAAYSEKYGEDVSSTYHLLKSLIYFQDADLEPMPKMIKNVDWADVRQFMIQKVKEIGFP